MNVWEVKCVVFNKSAEEPEPFTLYVTASTLKSAVELAEERSLEYGGIVRTEAYSAIRSVEIHAAEGQPFEVKKAELVKFQ